MWRIVLCSAALVSLPLSAHAQEPLVIRSATVIDGRGGPPRANTTLLIRDGRIAALGPDGEVRIPDGATVLDGRGKWIMPGLIEVHTHSYSRPVLRHALALGVTSALIVVPSDTSKALEWWSAHPASPAPRVYIAPGGFSGLFPENLYPGAFGARRTRSPDEARRQVDELADGGARHLKIWQDDGSSWSRPGTVLPTLPADVLREVIRTAHRRGVRVHTHAVQMRYAREAVDAGTDALMHPVFDTLIDPAVARQMASRGVTWPMTLTGFLGLADARAYARHVLSDRRLTSGVAEATLASLARDTTSDAPVDTMWAVFRQNHGRYRANIVRNTAAVVAAGVPLSVGSDCRVGLCTQLELELMVEAGLSPAQVLVAATSGGARALGILSEAGTLELGKRADLLVLRSNPLLDVRNARDIEWTIKGGRRFRNGEPVSTGAPVR